MSKSKNQVSDRQKQKSKSHSAPDGEFQHKYESQRTRDDHHPGYTQVFVNISPGNEIANGENQQEETTVTNINWVFRAFYLQNSAHLSGDKQDG